MKLLLITSLLYSIMAVASTSITLEDLNDINAASYESFEAYVIFGSSEILSLDRTSVDTMEDRFVAEEIRLVNTYKFSGADCGQFHVLIEKEIYSNPVESSFYEVKVDYSGIKTDDIFCFAGLESIKAEIEELQNI